MKWAKATAFGFIFFFTCIDLRAEEDSERVRILRNIQIEAGTIATDAICLNCSIIVCGQLDGDAIAIGGDIVVEGTLSGDAIALGGSIRALPGSRANADLLSMCGTVHVEPGAVITGDIESYPYFHLPGQRSIHPLGALVFGVVNLGMVLGLGYLIRPVRSQNLARTVRLHPWLTVSAGLIMVMLYVLLLVPADMLPRLSEVLIMLITLAFLALCTYGYVGMAWLAGQIAAGGRPRLLTWLAGSLALTLLFLIPVVGFVAIVAVFLLAPGSVVLSRFGSDPDGLVGRLLRAMRSRPWIDAAGIW